MKIFGVCYWYVKIPQCVYVEHGLVYITFYVQKHMAPMAVCSGPSLVRDTPLGAPAFVRLAYWLTKRSHYKHCFQLDNAIY